MPILNKWIFVVPFLSNRIRFWATLIEKHWRLSSSINLRKRWKFSLECPINRFTKVFYGLRWIWRLKHWRYFSIWLFHLNGERTFVKSDVFIDFHSGVVVLSVYFSLCVLCNCSCPLNYLIISIYVCWTSVSVCYILVYVCWIICFVNAPMKTCNIILIWWTSLKLCIP